MKTRITASVNEAARAIREGKAVGFPTETVYGLGANAFDARAVKKIFKAKGRPAGNPLIVHVWGKAQVRQIAKGIPPVARKLMEKFFPGPLTLVFRKREAVPDVVTAGLPTVCVRMPSLPVARRFLRACKVPVAAPSANISGGPSPTSWKHVLLDLNGRIPLILQGPESTHGLESTVVDCTRFPPVLLRPGAITVEEMEKVAGRIRIPLKYAKALSPGMAYRHYSPKARVLLVVSASEIRQQARKWAFIGFESAPFAPFSLQVRDENQYAKFLYSFFRQCDSMGVQAIFAQRPARKGLGRAILDRLERASRN